MRIAPAPPVLAEPPIGVRERSNNNSKSAPGSILGRFGLDIRILREKLYRDISSNRYFIIFENRLLKNLVIFSPLMGISRPGSIKIERSLEKYPGVLFSDFAA